MKPIEIYKRFLLKVNKNDTNANIKIGKGIFVLLFNEQKRQLLDDKIKGKESNDFIEDLHSLLKTDYKLKRVDKNKLSDKFELPHDFFRRVGAYALTKKDKCKHIYMDIWFRKPKDIGVLLKNDNQNPSFEFQETIATLSNNSLTVYKDNFDIEDVYLSYYFEPKDIDIEGYIHIDGTKSNNIETELDNFLIEEILNRAAEEAVRNYESLEQTQLAMQRQQRNEGTIN